MLTESKCVSKKRDRGPRGLKLKQQKSKMRLRNTTQAQIAMSKEVDFEQQHPRLVIRNFLSLDECKELEFIHKSSSTIRYRPNVFSTTLSHLIATNSSHFIIPFILIRERLKDKLEEFFKSGAEEQALDDIVMITDPISNNVTLQKDKRELYNFHEELQGKIGHLVELIGLESHNTSFVTGLE